MSSPVDIELRRRRAAVLLRPVLVLPALALLLALGLLALLAAALGWAAALVRGRMPRGLRDAAAYAIGYGAQVASYALLATDRYPNARPRHQVPGVVHPVSLQLDEDLARPRLLVGFRPLLVVPHLCWLALWAVPAALAAAAAWVVALASGRVPSPLHRFLAAFVRTTTHVAAFLHLVGRPFPGFVGRAGSYPSDLTVAPAVRQHRLGILARLVLALPALLLASVYALVALVVGALGWFAALATGRMPLGLRDLGASSLRYQAQALAYLLLLTPRYPDASPALDRRPGKESA